MSEPALLRPEWPAPPGVQAAFTLRAGGVSRGAFATLNLGAHVGDDARAVSENRGRVARALALPAEPLWLAQLHAAAVVRADRLAPRGAGGATPEADAAVTQAPGCVLVVLVADCLPVLLARRDGGAIGIAHAGWRGLAAGVIEAAVAALDSRGGELQAWLGPAIGPEHFEVGDEVRNVLCAQAAAAAAFRRNARGRWQCDLRLLARQRLAALGIAAIFDEPRCTYAQPQAFYSYRRDGVTGRSAAMIWRQ